jgi:S-DNA-T family DNA segregation ATPase FtsK/SpoIIIE
LQPLAGALTGAHSDMTRKRSKRKTTRRPRASRKAKRRFELTPEQLLDITGYFLIAIGALTLLSFPSGTHGAVLGWWLSLLRRAVGWGAYLTPLFFIALGIWIAFRRVRDRLPRLNPAQLAGAGLAYLTLLATLHSPAVVAEAAAGAWEAANAGMGGGYLGAALALGLRQGLGAAGLTVALVTLWLVVLVLLFGVTVRQITLPLASAVRQLRSARSPRGSSRVEQPRPKAPRRTRPRAVAADLENEKDERSEPTPPPRKPKRELARPRVTPRLAATPAIRAPSSRAIWVLPPPEQILKRGKEPASASSRLREQSRVIEETLASFGAPVAVREISPGPVVTQFGVEPGIVRGSRGAETRVKVSRIAALVDDLALALAAKTIRIEAPIPGKPLVGIQVPNRKIGLVALGDVMDSPEFEQIESPLRLCLGKDVSGTPVVADLAQMPHLLIAGTTGSGKSVCVSGIITALLLQNTPDELRLLLVDPKRVELTGFNSIPHLISDVVVDMDRVPAALKWVLAETDGRYRRFSEAGATNIADYNERIAPATGESRLPFIVLIIDELADLMMVAPHETETALCRIAQRSRATGIHMVIATQRPSVDIVTGLIKANLPARIAFNVPSTTDSRVIIDTPGAERLLGRGDMLFLAPDAAAPRRLQGSYVSDEELDRLAGYWREQGGPEAIPAEELAAKTSLEKVEETQAEVPAVDCDDELLPDVVALVIRRKRASISMFQRRLRIGYTRAARLMDCLAQKGLVGPQPPGGKAREVHQEAARAFLDRLRG